MTIRSIERVYKEINKVTRTRRLNLTVREICRAAGISSATFYTYFDSCENARDYYEKQLEANFLQLLPCKIHDRELTLTIFLSFLCKNRQYFLANLQAGNIFLMRKFIWRLKVVLVGLNMNERTFRIYAGTVIAILLYWIEVEKCNETLIPTYVREILRVRPMRYE